MGGKLLFLILFASQSICNQLVSAINPSSKDDKGSLVFVFDTTGSMFNDLKQLREGAEMILKTALEESNIIGDFVFVPFHDPAVGPATVTTQKEVFKSALNIVRVYGGGDCPERSLGGIQLALNVSRPRSFVYVFTDATASDHKLVDKVLENIQRKQSQVVFVLTGHCNDVDKPSYKVYQQIAAASSGQIFNLNKTSVYKVLEFVRSSIKGRTVNLGSTVNPAGYNYTQTIPIDKTVNEVTVSVSGAEPRIHFVSPSGEEVTGPPQLVTILDLSEIMIVSVLSPEAGVWGVRAGSAATHSVRVRARSEIDITHGFSVARVTDLKETTYRPLKGTYNNMLISLSGNESVKLDHAELLDLNGKLLFEVPLKEVDAVNNMYMAEAFIPPEEFFNIAVVGVDSSGETVRRTGRTAVSATDPGVPYLAVPKKVVASAHSRVVLRCVVESLVPVRAGWTRRGRDLHAHTHSLQSTTVDHVIEDMTEGDVGTYRCVASNAAGRATADTGLDMIVSPPQVSLSAPGAAPVQSHVVLRCSVYSDTYVQRARIEFKGDSRHYATDFHLEPSIDGFYSLNITIESASEADTGVYTCLAVNRGGVSNHSTNLIVLPKPTAVILGPHTLTKLIHSHIQLVCHVDNANQILWAYNDYVIEKKDINGSYNAMLNVDNLKEDGTWTCKAITETHNASDSVQVVVHIKPQVTITGPKNISLPQNSTYDVTCSVVARPQPRVLWHRETEEFLYHVLSNPEPNVYTSVLTVNGTAATYFCFGENAEGIDQDSVVVNTYTPMVIVQGLTDTSVALYSPVKLYCNISASPLPTTTWYHNNTRVQTNKNTINNETSLLIEDNVLIINRVDFDNLGNYSCEADNGYQKMVLNCSLSVHGLAKPLIYKEPVKVVVHRGKSLNLTCRVLSGNPKPYIKWQHSQNSNFKILPDAMIKNDSVVIHKVDKEHAGRYRCEASNMIGGDVYDVIVLVQYPPELNLSQEMYNNEGPIQVKSEDKIRLHCNVIGDPLPIVTWTKNALPVTYSSHIYLSNDSLVIENATKSDSGVFACNASNILGAVIKNFTIIVYKSPTISNNGNTEVQVLEGQQVELPCLVTGLPEPGIRWTHKGQDITDVRRHRDEYGLRFVANLTDFGKYECIASNAFGNASLNYTLYIWVAPSIDSPLEEIINIKQGSNTSFECDAVGFPVPTISWEFNDVILNENTTHVSFNNVGYMSITNAPLSVSGSYSCIADNIAGTALKNYVVLVNEPPRLLDDEYSGVYVASTLDREVKVSCRAAGDPPPYVYWTKDGVGLQSDAGYIMGLDGTLSISHPTEQHSGVYSCTAMNSAGTDTKDLHVQIYSPPSPLQEAGSPVVSSVEGSALRVSCPVRGNVTVKWYKDAILISNGTLNFSNISRSNASTYACVASNVIGSVHTNVIVDVQWPPKIQDGGDVDILAGNDLYLNCTTDAKPQAEIQWFFNSKALIGENKERLSVWDVTVYNSGIYRCVATNTRGTATADTRVHVLEPPFLSNFDYLDVELKAGVNATLECNAAGTPPPNITWTYNNTDWVLQNTSLVSYNVTSLSEGVLVCRAANRAGTRSLSYHVVVVAAALVEGVVMFVEGEGMQVDGSVEIAIGINARLACKASGNPEPIIQWLHNGNTMSNNTGMYADLIFKNVTNTNKGMYVCVASNIGGVHQRRVKVDVLEPPRIFQSLFHNANSSQNGVRLEVITNQVFYLHCHPYGNPTPDVYWFKDGVPLKFYDDEMVSKDFGEIVISKSAKYGQSGNYTCVARNRVGNTSVSYLVDVLVPPPPQKGDIKEVSTISGSPLNMTCPSEGRPPPVVTWIKHPYTEVVDTARIHLMNYNYTLFFTKTEISDSGKYSCVITNSVGTAELAYDVTVQAPPTIAGNHSQLVIPLGRSIVLKCNVDGAPEPKVTWFQDIQPLSPTSANVHRALHTHVVWVWSARAAHAGEYRCVAENPAGIAQRRYSVTVKVPGKWSAWSPWSYCNVTCGSGYQRRERRCQYIDDNNNIIDKDNKPVNILIDESTCKGSTVNRRKCHMPSCEARPSALLSSWSPWSVWSACSASCGAGSQLRTRLCRGGHHCDGDDLQIRKCINLPKCESRRQQLTVDEEDVGDNGINTDYIPEATFEMRPDTTDLEQPTSRTDEYIVAQAPPLYEVKVTENIDHSERGPCDPGHRYIPKNNSCEDIDECVSPFACHSTQTCVNTARGYACSCAPGYSSLGAGQRCLDVNECTQGLHGCEFACVNTAGGYVCACPQPLRLHDDKRHCVEPSTHHEPEQYDDDYAGTVML